MYYDPSGYSSTKMKAKGCPPESLVNESDIDDFRNELMNPEDKKTNILLETVAVGRTDIEEFKDDVFKGASPQVIRRAHKKGVDKKVIDYIDNMYPNRKIKAPYDYINIKGHSQYAPHAEEMVLANFESRVRVAGYDDYSKVKGNLYIIQSNVTGVCNKCTVGLFKDHEKGVKGIFKRFSEEFPNVNVYVTTYGGGSGGRKGMSTYSFNIIEGKIYNKKGPK